MGELKGTNGSMSFDGRTVTITRKGAAALVAGSSGTRTVPLASITGVSVKAAGLMQGHLALDVPGTAAVKARNKTQAQQRDENTITFGSKGNDAARALADEINAAILAGSAPAAAAPDVTEQLRKLGELRDSGVLTQAEFDTKKAELLARL